MSYHLGTYDLYHALELMIIPSWIEGVISSIKISNKIILNWSMKNAGPCIPSHKHYRNLHSKTNRHFNFNEILSDSVWIFLAPAIHSGFSPVVLVVCCSSKLLTEILAWCLNL